MSRIIVFGAAGRLGRLVVAEAARRGHDVTAAHHREPPSTAGASAEAAGPSPGADRSGPRESSPAPSGSSTGPSAGVGPSAPPGPIGPIGPIGPRRSSGRVDVAVADVLDAAAVARAAAGHDAAVASLYQDVLPHDEFYARSTAALLRGLAEAGVGRLVVVGAAPNLEVAPGVRLMDAPTFPAEHLAFALGHTAALHVLRAVDGPVDWLMVTPPMVFSPDAPATGAYRLGGDAFLLPPDDVTPLAYADAATALVDEATTPTRHRERAALA